MSASAENSPPLLCPRSISGCESEMARKRSPPSPSSSSSSSTSSSDSGSSSSTSRSLPSSTSSGSSRSSSLDKRSRSPSSSSSSLRSYSSNRKRHSRRPHHRLVKSRQKYEEWRHRRRSPSPRGSSPGRDYHRSGRRGYAYDVHRRGGGRKQSLDERDRYHGRPRRQHSDDWEEKARRSSRDRKFRSRTDGKHNGDRGRDDWGSRDDRTHYRRRKSPLRNRAQGHPHDRDHNRKKDSKPREDNDDPNHGRSRGGNGKNSERGGKRRTRDRNVGSEREDHNAKRRKIEGDINRVRSRATHDAEGSPNQLEGDVAGNECKRGKDSQRPREDVRRATEPEQCDVVEASRGGMKPSAKSHEQGKLAGETGPNFGLSGKLAEESRKVKGVVMKFTEPPEARKPDLRWRLYIFKGGEVVGEPIPIHRQSYYLFGRDRAVTDIPTDHPSCSKQHSVLQFRCVEVENAERQMTEVIKPYLMDLESVNGTFINRERLEPHRYYELMEQDTVRFGLSSREYVLLHEGSVG